MSSEAWDLVSTALGVCGVAAFVAFALAALSLMGPPDPTVSPSPILWRFIKWWLRRRNRK